MSHSLFVFFLADVVVVVVAVWGQVTQGPFTWRNSTFFKTLSKKKKNAVSEKKKIMITLTRSTEYDAVPLPSLGWRCKFSVVSVRPKEGTT